MVTIQAFVSRHGCARWGPAPTLTRGGRGLGQVRARCALRRRRRLLKGMRKLQAHWRGVRGRRKATKRKTAAKIVAKLFM